MTAPATRPIRSRSGLDGAALLVPELSPEPLPVRAIPGAPCTRACPAGVNVKAYVSLIAEERFAEALEVVRQRCPLAGICGRICHHPCEEACERGPIDGPVAIRALKRFIADVEGELPPSAAGPEPPERALRAAVVGSGPAGLTAAYDLRRAGYPVKVFEAEAEPGGMLRYGIAPYRLPREILDAEIDALLAAGIEIETGRRLGADLELERLLADGYAAVLLAVGAQRGRRLRLPDEERFAEVEDALTFLRRVNDGDRTPLGGRVAVIGGGSTAIEAARTARRLGARPVTVVYRRSPDELLAAAEEIHAAEAEGIEFRFLTAPAGLVAEDGRFAGLECLKVGLGEPDASGRRRPVPIPGSEHLVAADRVLAAVGQEADLSFVPPMVMTRVTERGRLLADPDTAMTRLFGVFAAGDAVTGPATVIEAVAAGHRAAASMRRWLEEGEAGVPDAAPPGAPADVEYGLPDPPPLPAAAHHPPLARLRRSRAFAEVEGAFSAADAVAEARRCMRCGPCSECRLCAPSCRRRHLTVRLAGGDGAEPGPAVLLRAPASLALGLDPRRPVDGRLLAPPFPATLDGGDGAAVEILPLRATVDPALCRGCARCLEVCSFGAIRLLDPADPESKVAIDPAFCRGCNLCTAVCPTLAAAPSALSPEWWGAGPSAAFRLAAAHPAPAPPYVVLACQRRAGAVERRLAGQGGNLEVIRLRCVGQIDAGMLVELVRLGARRVLVAGCLAGRCRYDAGARRAAAEVERACAVLGHLGAGDGTIVADWSASRAEDPLDTPLAELILAGAAAAGPRPVEARR